MGTIPTPDQALDLVRQYNHEEFHLRHAQTVGWVLGYLSKTHDPGRESYWQTVGILHDIDFEQWPQEHCKKAQVLLQELDVDEGLGPLLRRKAGKPHGAVLICSRRADRVNRRRGPYAAHGLGGHGGQVGDEKVQG